MRVSVIIAGIFLLLTSEKGNAQFSKYIIRFKDKNNSPYSLNNPSAYLSAKAIQRRINYAIPTDSTDLPVNPAYIQAVINTGNVTLLNRSKWLNAITIQTTDANALAAINNLPFVQSTNAIALRIPKKTPPAKFNEITTSTGKVNPAPKINGNYYNYGVGDNQITLTKGDFLHNIGLRGDNITLSLLDDGFFGYLTNTAFDSARNNNQFLGSWDFVANEASVNEDNSHGMNCLSEIAANWPGIFVGTAPKAQFWLLRTEDDNSEQPIEEYNWASGAEYADSAGTDLISSSLGYSTFDDPSFDHSYTDMNGKTTPGSIAAGLAVKKGILVVNSAGNEGNNTWKYITTPSDGINVLCVGATATNGSIASFSSYGPSADGRVKPDVVTAGQGIIVAGTNSEPATSNGTSFSCPNMAGLAACLWEGFPEFNNLSIIDAIQKSADKFNNPDDHYGYGVPNMKTAFGLLLKAFATSSVSVNNCVATLRWTSKDLSTMRYEIERKLPGEADYSKITEINGKGNHLAIHDYACNDTLYTAAPGTAYYRIKQITDTTAAGLTAVYIDTANAEVGDGCIKEGITVYPNPASKNLTISIVSQKAIPQLSIFIFDMTGKMIAKKSSSITAGKSNLTIPVAGLARGEYIIVLYNGNNKMNTFHFIKQ